MPSERQDTALVTAMGGLGATSSLCPSWVMYLRDATRFKYNTLKDMFPLKKKKKKILQK